MIFTGQFYESIFSETKMFRLMETYICLPNLLAGGLPAGALAASIASHTLQTQNTHTLQTIYVLYLKIKTQHSKHKN